MRDQKFDGFIVTGAPVELLDFEDVTYWDELRRIFDWTQTHVHSTFNICWGAQAALYHFHGVPKHALADEGLRRLPPPQSESGLALPARLLRRFLDSGVALDREPPCRLAGRTAVSKF